MTKTLLPLLALTMMACGGTPDAPISSGNGSDGEVSSIDTGDGYKLSDALSWFNLSGTYVTNFTFFDSEKVPGATTRFLDNGCYTAYRNFENLSDKNMGYIDIDADLAAKKGVEAGVYTWKSEKVDNKNTLVLGNKVGTTTYRDVIYTPADIAKASSTYMSALEPEIEGQNSGFFFLNKGKENKDLLTSFAKSLGVYETITGAGLELNYAKIYFGATSKSININIYSKYGSGYDLYDTTVNCASFGEVNIAELANYTAS